MATEPQEKQEDSVEPRTDEHHNVIDEPEERETTEKPEITDEHREKAKEMAKSMDQDRPTVAMPGTGGAVAGTAINDWLDDDGNPKFSDTEKDSGKSEG
jgi:hypothetical protein